MSQPHQHCSQLRHRHGQQENPPCQAPVGREGWPRPRTPAPVAFQGLCGALHLMPVPGTPAALAQPRRHRAGPGHPTTVPAQPRSRHALPHAEPDPVMWPGRETEAAEGAGGCQRVLGLVVPGTPQMGLGEGGSRRKGLRGKRSRFPLITAKPQPAGRAGGAFRLGLKSTEGHTCDEHARSQHNRTDSPGGGGGCGLGGVGIGGTGKAGQQGALPTPPQPLFAPAAQMGMCREDGKFPPPASGARAGVGGPGPQGGVTPATAPPAWQGSGPGAGGGVPKAVLPGKGGGPQLPCPGHRSPVPPHGSGKVGAAPHQPPQVWVHSCTPILREGCEEGGLQPPGAPGTARAR